MNCGNYPPEICFDNLRPKLYFFKLQLMKQENERKHLQCFEHNHGKKNLL